MARNPPRKKVKKTPRAGQGSGGPPKTRLGPEPMPSRTSAAAAERVSEPTARQWLIKRLLEVEKLAGRYHRDFTRYQTTKGRWRLRVPKRLATLLAKYAEQVDKLRRRFRSPPQDVSLHVPGLGGLWGVASRIQEALDGMHEAIEHQQAKLAAPMDEEEQREFWRAHRQLATGADELGRLAKHAREWIERERSKNRDPQLERIELTFTQLCDAVADFFKAPRSGEDGALQSVQVAAADYREKVAAVSKSLDAELPDPEKRESGRKQGHIAAGVDLDDLKQSLRLQALLLDSLLQQDAVRFGLPLEAERRALEIRKIINPALRDNHRLVARLAPQPEDVQANADTIAKDDLPEYTRLAESARENEQLQVLVDCGLALQARHEPTATWDRKKFEKHVQQLAQSRGVTGLGSTSAWNKLNTLVERGLFRKFPAKKTRTNPNASDEYRLGLSAQAKYESRAAAASDEIDRLRPPDDPTFDA